MATRIVHDNVRFSVEEWTFDRGDRHVAQFMVRKPDAAAAIVHSPDHVLIVEHFRVATSEWGIEIPGGRIESGETPEATALRELEEETSLRLDRLAPFLLGFTMPSLTTEMLHVFEGKLERPLTAQRRESNQHLRCGWVRIEELADRIARQPFFTLDTLLLSHWLNLRLKSDLHGL